MLKKTKPNKKTPILSKVLFLLGLILITISLTWKFSQTDLSFRTNLSNETSNNFYQDKKLLSISIPKTNTFLEIEEGKIINGKWEVSNDKATHYAHSSSPGEKGNIVIYGHNKNEVFGRLSELTNGDYINIYTNEKKVYKYIVKNIEIVSPDRIEVIAPEESEVLTVYTCTGIFDSRRLVLKAYPIQVFTSRN